MGADRRRQGAELGHWADHRRGPAPWDERCAAQVKYVQGWRCNRAAAVGELLCVQHYMGGCLLPPGWEHEVNEWGVDVPTATGPVERLRPAWMRERDGGPFLPFELEGGSWRDHLPIDHPLRFPD